MTALIQDPGFHATGATGLCTHRPVLTLTATASILPTTFDRNAGILPAVFDRNAAILAAPRPEATNDRLG